MKSIPKQVLSAISTRLLKRKTSNLPIVPTYSTASLVYHFKSCKLSFKNLQTFNIKIGKTSIYKDCSKMYQRQVLSLLFQDTLKRSCMSSSGINLGVPENTTVCYPKQNMLLCEGTEIFLWYWRQVVE